MELFRPKMYKKSIFDIDYQKLKDMNIQLIIFDLDNTIAEVGEALPSKKVINLINKLSKQFKIVIASNNFENRVRLFCEKLNCDYFYMVLKPSIKIGLLIKKKYHINSKDTCIIGDQVITDVLMGNRLKMFTILVDPIGKNDYRITSFNRTLERMVLKRMKIEKGMYYE